MRQAGVNATQVSFQPASLYASVARPATRLLKNVIASPGLANYFYDFRNRSKSIFQLNVVFVKFKID